MRPRRELTRPIALLLNSVDRHGRTVESSVLSVAQEIAPRAVSFGERLLGDPALALTLFEEVAAAVSRTLKEKLASGRPGIRDMRGYLFRAYLRRINVETKSTFAIKKASEELWDKNTGRPDESDIERRILLKEVLESCDTLTREILYLRLEGCSWKEIEKRCGIPLNAASLRFSKALRRLRKLVRSKRTLRTRGFSYFAGK
jgi:DNA-directed RNA polymerase specialized sigma24 family protein